MMASYWETARTGFLAFVGVGLLVLVPLILLHYFRFRRVEPRRAFVLYGLLLYGLVALALIFLPFPTDPANLCTGDQMLSTTPFQWVTDMSNNMAAYGRHGIAAMVQSQAFLQQLFNVALFVPLGIVLRKAYSKGPLAVIAIAAGLSLAVEVVQYTGNLGFYPCPYRIADVDDLISNTFGGLLGWMLAPAAFVVPRVPSSEESEAPQGTVTVPRRLLGLISELVLVIVIAKLVLHSNPLWAVCVLAAFRIVLPAATNGMTIGGILFNYRIRAETGARANPLLLIPRELLGFTGFMAYATVVSPKINIGWWDLAIVALYVGGAFVVPIFRRDQRGWHEQVAHTRDVFTHEKAGYPDRHDDVHAHS
ncbi:VanZ family protein [Lentzea sp. NPDC058450]|uniref:VanZ family protein n=1 Tax=Lentzea sp. NPDC058450 TaxID=3346505 RepID=UPI00365A2B20